MDTDMRPSTREPTSSSAVRGRDLAHGAARGAVGAMAMTGIRAVTGGLDIVRQTPPQAMIARRAASLLQRVPRGRRDVAVELTHWGYGAAGGAAYAALPSSVRQRSWAGAAYGLLTWAAFELALAPALGIARQRRRSIPERLAIGVDHFVYGLVIAEIRPAHKGQR